MTARWARRRLATGLVAVMLAPVLAVLLSAIPGMPGAQGVDDPTPFVTFAGVPTAPFIGQDVAFDVSFSNTSGTKAGYGPYIDLSLPLGPDGNDGLTFVGATYLSAPVTSTVLTAVGNCITHPYAVQTSGLPVQMCGLVEGSSYVVLRLPFGSFTPGQPAAIVHVTTHLSSLADAGTVQTMTARGGFQFGATPLNDYATDASIVGVSTTTADISPTVISVTKSYIGPENETATGPNYPRSYRINVSVAPGQPIGNLTIVDALPNSMQYLSTNTPLPGHEFASITEPSTVTPGGSLTINFGPVTGTGGVDATATFNFNIPRVDSVAAAVLPATTGAFNTSMDSVTGSGTWTPTDVRDTPTVVTSNAATHTLNDKSIAVQKTVALINDSGPTGVNPGDTLQWTVQVEVSDYFALNTIAVDDLLGDGTLFDTGFTPTLQVDGNGFTSVAAAFDAANYSNAPTPDGSTGKTLISFRLSNELISRGYNGRMVGGCVDPAGVATPNCSIYNNGATTATVVFRSIVQQTYVKTGVEVVEGDTLHNDAAATGIVLHTNDFSSTGNTIGDGSAGVADIGTSASVEIQRGSLAKTIYAVNGIVRDPEDTSPVHVSPGDTVTYRLVQSFPTSRTDDFRIYDYLPLPVFAASGMTFDPVMSADAPAADHAKYGPEDSFHLSCNSLVPASCPDAPSPAVTFDGTANSLEFAYGDYALYPPAFSQADILFTVTVSTNPFADGLLLTNQARSQTRNAIGTLQTADAIIQLTLDQPVLGIKKGVVRTDNVAGVFSPPTTGPVTFDAPGAPPTITCPGFGGGPITSANLGTSPIDSDLTGVDAGDYVRFAIVVENKGHSAAFDVTVNDTLPAGFIAPAGGIEMCVTTGAGVAIGTSNLGTGLFDVTGGIQLDNGGSGSLAAGLSGSGVVNGTGSNIAVITYTLQVDISAVPSSVITNTATLTNFSNDPGAANHLSGTPSDTATVTIASPSMTKYLIATSETTTGGTSVAIGEILTYQVEITVPEGTSNLTHVVDSLPAAVPYRLVPMDCSPITASAGLTSSTVTFGDPCAMGTNPTVSGNAMTFDLGTVVNWNSSNGTAETIVLTYRVVVTNVPANTRGAILQNSAALTWTGGSLTPVAADSVTIVEPSITTAKTSDKTIGDSGDTIQYTVTILNVGTGGNRADAFGITLSDPLPTGMTYAGAFTKVSGTDPDSPCTVGATIICYWAHLVQGAGYSFTFEATIDQTAAPGHTFANTATSIWSGLPGDVTAPQSPAYSAVSTERTGLATDPGGASVNTYHSLSTRNVGVPTITMAKTQFATNQAHTSGTNVAIGEIVSYRIVATIPEGTTPAAQLIDTLPAGMAFVHCTKIEASSADVQGTFASACSDPANPTVGAGGQLVTFSLGTITNVNVDNGTPETITLEYDAVVLNVAGSVHGTLLTNSARMYWTGGNSAIASAPNDRVVEPIMTLSKTPSPVIGDAGDTIDYTIVVANPSVSNNADAFNVVWTDAIPAGLTYVPGSLQCTGTCPVLDDSLAPVLSGTWASFTLAAPVATITYQAQLNWDVPSGSHYDNTANITWTSLPGDIRTAQSTYSTVSTERTGAGVADPGANNNYKVTKTARVDVPQPVPAKTLAYTSESDVTSTSPYVVVGEVTRFRVAVVIPEGITPTVTITDQLPAGLSYLNDGTTTVALVTNGAGMTSDVGTLSGAGLGVSGNGSWAGDPTFVMPAGQISGGPFADGTDPTFAFGTLTNSDRDGDQEMIVIEFNVLVDNVGTSTAGVGLMDQATIYSGGVALAAAGTYTVTIAEPSIAFSKTITTTPLDGGDTIVYRITVTNGSGAAVSPAYDVNVTDDLDGHLSPVGHVTGGGSSVSADASSGSRIDITFDRILPGASAWIDVTATVSATVDAGTIIPNTANGTWTSEPGLLGTTSNSTGSSTPGASGTATGERNQGDLGVSDTVNTYHDTKSVSVTLHTPTIAKGLPSTASLPVGGTATYDLVVTLPEGTTRALIVTDNLPAGLTRMGAVVVPGTYGGTLSTPTQNADTGDLGGAWTFTFGDTVLPADGSAANDVFTIRITVRVANVAANIKDKTLVNTANITYTDPVLGVTTSSLTPDRTITVTAPKLKVTKTVSANNPHFGATVTYTIKIEHQAASSSNSTAYDIVVTDTLPAGLTLQTGTLTHVAGVPGGQTANSATAVGNTVTLTYNSLAFGTTSSYTFDAVVGAVGVVTLGQTLTNTATATWTSMSGVVYERTGNPADTGGALNNYTIPGSVLATVTGIDMTLTKTHTGLPVAGQPFTFHANYHNAGNQTATGVVLTETVPVGTTYTGSGWVCASGTDAGKTCTFAVGSVNAGASASADFVVTIVNPIPTALISIDNTVSVADDGTHGTDPTLPNTATDNVLIPVADLSLTKTVDDSTPDKNQQVIFTVRVSNAGPAAATNVAVLDQLPAGLTYVSYSATNGGTYNSGSGVWIVGSVANGGNQTLTLRATVATIGLKTNYAEVSHSDQLDSDSTPGNRGSVHEDDDASASVTPNVADLAVTKSASPAHPNLNSDVTFTITATNNGPDSADNVVVTDTLPAGLSYQSSSATAGSYDNATHHWTIGTLAVGSGNSVTLTLVARVTQTGDITNTASITGGPFDPDLSNNSADITTSQLVDLEVTKVVDKPDANVAETVTFTMTVHNYGPGSANHVILHDVPPAGLNVTSFLPSQGSYSAISGDWTAGTIPVGTTITATATAVVVGNTPMTNTITVKSLDEPQTSTANDSASATVTPPHTDLQLTKTVAEARPDKGDKDHFTITVTNAGPDKATGVYVLDSAVRDTLSAAFTYDTPTAWTADQGTFDTSTGRWDIGDLESGASVTLTLNIVVDTDGDYTNTATVSGDQYDPTPGNNTDHADLTTRLADIDVQKAADNPAPTVGTTVTYTLTITNLGPDQATQLVIHDLLPVGLTYISNTPSTGTYDLNTGDWTIGTLAKDTPVTLIVTARVVGSGHISNTASVGYLLQRDTVSSNDQSTAEINVPPAADLSLTKTVDLDTPDKGTDVTFTISVTNHGPNATTGVHVGDLLPAGLTWVSDLPSAGAYDHETGDWAIGDMANGDVVTLSITATVEIEGPITNTAEVTASSLPDPDSTPGNSDPGEDDQASAQVNSRGLADLQVVKTVNPTGVRKGQQTIYTIVVTNNGPDAATSVIVRDQLPSGVTFVSSAGGDYDKTTGAWTVGNLAYGGSATLTITVLVGQTGSIDNTAEVAHTDQRDPLPANDVDSVDVSAGGATAPPTSAKAAPAPAREPGSTLPLLISMVVASILLMASAALTARNRRFTALVQVSVDLPRRYRRPRTPRKPGL
ncbi:MAG TPA: hypothetical protein VF337_05465 [Candidatus Limnocylindrales bacterium]